MERGEEEKSGAEKRSPSRAERNKFLMIKMRTASVVVLSTY
jgi:hypothetical protein